jgi:hypothetical protein
MNEATSEKLEHIPLPARQQLGIFNDTVDKDARSGNGLKDRLDFVDANHGDYQQPAPEQTGTLLMPVTYHLEREPQVHSETHGNVTTAYQRPDQDVTTQHEVPGVNERTAERAGLEDSGSVHAESGQAAGVRVQDTVNGGDAPSQVPDGSIQQVLAWVGNDKDRAQAALDAEQAKPTPRSSLVEKLNERL